MGKGPFTWRKKDRRQPGKDRRGRNDSRWPLGKDKPQTEKRNIVDRLELRQPWPTQIAGHAG